MMYTVNKKDFMRTVSFDIHHNGKEWVAHNDEITVTGETLDELDENIKLKLKKILSEGRVKVTMELDYRRNVPHWIWQYHPYYFYRTIFLDLD